MTLTWRERDLVGTFRELESLKQSIDELDVLLSTEKFRGPGNQYISTYDVQEWLCEARRKAAETAFNVRSENV